MTDRHSKDAIRSEVDPLPSRHDDGHYDTCAIRADQACDCPASDPQPARGLHSNVVVNFTAREAVALGKYLRSPERWTCDKDALAAVEKCLDAADRATDPWEERDRGLPF